MKRSKAGRRFFLGFAISGIFLTRTLVAYIDGERFDLTGQVAAVDPAESTISVRHGAIDGWLGAGETQFSIGRGDGLLVSPGDSIRGAGLNYDGGYRLEGIWLVDPVADNIVTEVNRRLRHDTVTRGSKVYRAIGEFIPHFAFYNQDGQVIQSPGLRGSMVVVNFIFTRCAMPNMCPASTERMARLQHQIKEAGIEKVRMVSISLDPEYDTPGILKQYAADKGIDTANFDFLTGSPRAISDVLQQFGIQTFDKQGILKHNMATLLVNEKGKIIFRRNGSLWSVDEFFEWIKK